MKILVVSESFIIRDSLNHLLNEILDTDDIITVSNLNNVLDKELLEMTNGIIQGMSGSPIIQNNKIVGAVTHVFMNDPTKGYGIYIEWIFDKIYEWFNPLLIRN